MTDISVIILIGQGKIHRAGEEMKSSVLSIVTFALAQALTAACAFGGIWEGKRVSVSGDSYSAFGGLHGSHHSHYPGKTTVQDEGQMWWAQVIREFGGVLESNRSCAGGAITTRYGICLSMWDMAKDGQLGSPDVILVLGGLNNDWVLKHEQPKFLSEVTKYFNVLDSEYAAAEKYVILCKIHEQIDYRWGLRPMCRQVLREESRKRGYKVIDLDGYYGNESGDFDTAETPHPTLQGMNKIAKRVISEIRNGPGGYRELYDCLTTDDLGYLITDYVPNLTRTKVTVRARFSTDIRAKNVMFYAGGYTAGVEAANIMSFIARYGGFNYVNSTDGGVSSVGPAWGVVPPLDGEIVTMSVSGNSLMIDGAEIPGRTTPANVDANGHLVLFAERTGRESSYSGMAPKTICNIRITEGNTVVRDFYPAISKDGVATLWDSLTDSCLPVSGGGVFGVADPIDLFVNRTSGAYFGDLADAIAAAKDGETVGVKVRPPDSVAAIGRMGVALDRNGNDNVTLVPTNGYYKVVQDGGIQTIVIDPDIQPQFDCKNVCDLFKPEGGVLKVRLLNVRKGLYYALFTATDLNGPWTPVGNGFEVEKADFEVPAPPSGTKAFFIKAVVRE